MKATCLTVLSMMFAVTRLKHMIIETEGADEEFGKEYSEYADYAKYADYADKTGIQLSRIVINIFTQAEAEVVPSSSLVRFN